MFTAYNARAPPFKIFDSPYPIKNLGGNTVKSYIYKTATGNVIVELDESWHDILTTEDHEDFNQERSHTRPDHKYAPGEPVSLNAGESTDDWLVFSTLTSYKAVELKVDLEMALETLTPLQRRYFVMNRIWGYKTTEIARFESKAQPTVFEVIMMAEKKIRDFLR